MGRWQRGRGIVVGDFGKRANFEVGKLDCGTTAGQQPDLSCGQQRQRIDITNPFLAIDPNTHFPTATHDFHRHRTLFRDRARDDTHIPPRRIANQGDALVFVRQLHAVADSLLEIDGQPYPGLEAPPSP